MPQWLSDVLAKSAYFMPHGHCYLWIPSLLWLHVVSDVLIGVAYVGISLVLWLLVRRIRLPFSPVFIAFGLFIALCGLTHFLEVWTVWNPDYWTEGLVKAATAAASVATAVGLVYVRPQVEEVVHAARLSEERRIRLESTNAELETLYAKVKELDELKSQFFANVSHELRTPLALILGPAETMLGDANLTDAQRRQLQSINDNGRVLLKQVNDLLDLTKLEAGKMPVRYAELDVASWFRRVASQFAVAAEQRGITYHVQAPDQLMAQADADKLERIFINLLSNAFKFTPGGGTVTTQLVGHDGELWFSVADTGPGVRPEQREIIFERFRQADGGATRSHGGTGLGLAIVKDFVELHRGRVAVSDAPGGGALFSVTLPRTAPAGTAVAAMPVPEAGSAPATLAGALHELAAGRTSASARPVLPGRPHLLVVEDNAEMRAFVADTLSDDYNVVTAADGQEGLERAQALKPDLIITDIMMPRMSGDQLVEALRAGPELDAVPILLLTAKADDELRVRLLQRGAQDYLTKPFLPQELRARVGNLVAAKRAGDALREELASLSTDLEGLAGEIALKNRQLKTALDAAEVAREQAERASEVKTYFLGMISHELRTPLSTIHMNLQLLSRDRSDNLPEPLQRKLNRAVQAARQMSSLVEGLLEYTRVESGRMDVRIEPVDPVRLAEDVVQVHADGAPPQIQVALAAPSEKLPLLDSDPRLLRVILSNLLSNALKFTSEGSITLRLAASDGQHRFEVHDTGIGIPQEDLHRVFEPFEQLEPVRRKSVPGIGLGLALVKQIAETLGGRVDVTSTPGAGSTFRIILPSRAATTVGNKE